MTKPFLVCFPVQKSFSPAPLQHPGRKSRGKGEVLEHLEWFYPELLGECCESQAVRHSSSSTSSCRSPEPQIQPSHSSSFYPLSLQRGARGTFAGFHRKWQCWLIRAIGYFNGNGDWEERGNHSTPNTALHSRISAWPGEESGVPPEFLLDETRTDGSLPFS